MRLKSYASPNTRIRTSLVWFGPAVLGLLIWSFAPLERAWAQGSPGTLSFSQAAINVNESDAGATITLTRTGGTDGEVTAKVSLADVTTSAADYRFSPGALDATFGQVQQASFLYHQTQIALQPDGKLLVASNHTVFRVNADGSPDPTFTTAVLNDACAAIALQPDGKMIIAGFFSTVNLVSKKGVARLNANGSLDPTFDPGLGTNNANIVALQADGKVLVGGGFSNFNLAPNTSNVARLNTDGSVDSTFLNGAGVSTTYAIVVQPDGKILLGGLGFVPIARMNSDGSADNTFSSDLGAVVLTIALQPDGKILAGGGFDHAGSQPVNNIARLHPNGALDPSFNSGSGPDQGVYDIAVQPDGKVIIGGDFRSINGVARINLARLHADGSLDTTFNHLIASNPGAGFVHGIVMQPDGKPIVGGTFTVGPGTRFNLARLQGDLIATWPAGDSSDKTITLPIVNDLLDEPDETLNLSLTSLTAGATTGPISNATITIVDDDVPPSFTSALPPEGITRVAYTHTFTATGTPAPTFNVTGGSLPPGLFLQSSGVLSGTPSTAATFTNITVTASNGITPVATQTFSITILNGGSFQFSSTTYSVAENAGPVTVTVNRTGGSAGAASVHYLTSVFGGTATSGTDYTAVTGTFNFADGETSKTFDIAIANDIVNERDETVNLALANSTGSANIGTPATAVLTILNDDPLPTISINDISVTEGDSAFFDTSFTVSLVGSIDRPVFFTAIASGGTAVLAEDYASGFNTRFQITPGTTSANYFVTILGDTIPEPDENFFVNLSAPDGATITDAQGEATILNNETTVGAPTVQFNFRELRVSEAAGVAIVNVSRSGDTAAPLTVSYATTSSTGVSFASDRGDYTLALGTLNFAAGESIKAFPVFITDDALVEANEAVLLSLFNPTTGSNLGTPVSSIIRIMDNDVVPNVPNPVDASAFFVRQHYRDFLNRDPDPAGLSFWVDQIESCGADQACREVKRINTSAAFFLSIEFQETGYLVYLLHKAAFNAGELLQVRTFMGDTQTISRGVVVGQQGWEALLDANKNAFVSEFIARTQFATLFPTSMTAAEFVDALNANTGDPLNPGAGGSLTMAERNQLIAELTSGAITRARAVRTIAENAEYRRRQFNKAFVLMQYFGYLRRNPNSTPDSNFNGYNFWLGKLNEFNGNYINAEMVKGFLRASEFRQRFGQP